MKSRSENYRTIGGVFYQKLKKRKEYSTRLGKKPGRESSMDLSTTRRLGGGENSGNHGEP